MRTAEFCLPLSQLDEALGDVIDVANHYAEKFSQYSLLPIYVRIVKTDDLYLSPANAKCPEGGTNEHACYVEARELITCWQTTKSCSIGYSLVRDAKKMEMAARSPRGEKHGSRPQDFARPLFFLAVFFFFSFLFYTSRTTE